MKIVALIVATLSMVATVALAEPTAAAAPALPAASAPPAAQDVASVPKDAATPPASAPATSNVVRYADDKVTLDVKEMSASDLVDEIARQAGAKITGSVGNAAPVTASWTDLPLKDALEHVLGAQNFTLTYSDQGELRTIQLRGQRQQGQQKREEFARGPGDIPPDDKVRSGPDEQALFKAFDLRDSVPIDGAMAKRLGNSTAPLDLLANTSIGDDDPAVRTSGMKSMMKMFDGNEALRSQVKATAGNMSDAALAAFARAYLFHRAEDFVHNVKREATDPDIRRRAGAVLRELRKNPYTGPRPVEGGEPLPPTPPA